MKRLNQAGSHLLAVLVGLVVIGGISFAGYTVVNHQNATSSTGTPVAASNDSAPDDIKTTAGLTTTAHALDTASGQVDGSLNDNTLNSDLNDLL